MDPMFTGTFPSFNPILPMKRYAFFLLLALLALPLGAHAQTSQTATASVTVSDILKITITNNTISFGTATAAGSRAGDVSTVVSHEGNGTHTVQIAANAANFTSTSGLNNTALPASRIEYSKDAGVTWVAASTTAASLVTSAAAGTYNNAVTVQYRMSVQASDPKDTYSLGLTYSVVSG